MRVDPLAERLLPLIDEVAKAELGAADLHGAALARAVRRVSDAYRRQHGSPAELASDRAALCARLRFFLPRDLPKIQAPLAELAAARALPSAAGDGSLRVLDVGAGLGASALGAAAFALAQPGVERVQIDAFDQDAAALALAGTLVRSAARELGARIDFAGQHAAIGPALLSRARPPYQLVVLGFVLNELAGDDARDATAQHRRTLAQLCELLAADGALIVLEPALRTHSRTLQAVRGLFAAEPGPPYVFAPCLHRGPCPLLQRERDWCHEQLPLALPPRLAEIARAAGLRTSELSFSYLTLAQAPRSLSALGANGGVLVRVVGSALGSKGKLELSVCGAGPTRTLRRLDRHASEHNRALAHASRGQVLRLVATERERAVLEVGPDTSVELVLRPPG